MFNSVKVNLVLIRSSAGALIWNSNSGGSRLPGAILNTAGNLEHLLPIFAGTY